MITFFKSFAAESEWRYSISLFKRLYMLLIIYTLLRVWFYIANNDIVNNYYFKSESSVFHLFVSGLHSDIVAIFFINLPLIFLHLIPVSFRNKRMHIHSTRILFCLLNFPFLFISIVDIYFFPYSLERSSASIISFSRDFFPLFFTYVRFYWFAVVILLVLLILLYYYSGKTLYSVSGKSTPVTQRVIFILAMTIWIFSVSELWKSARTNYHPLVTNSPYTIIRSSFTDAMFFNNTPLKEKNYFAKHDLNKQFSLSRYYYKNENTTKKMNVVVIVLESFSKQFVGNTNNGISYTPFLDSLSNYSLQFTNAFANARHSNESIPSIFSSLPSLMKESIILSKYKSNIVSGLADMLKRQSYTSAFFHGGINGVYGFDFFTRKTGFDKYYGKNEYANGKDFDGAWGIWDDKFFLYAAEEINKLKTPFVAGLFSVSSHHPFNIPDYFTNYPLELNNLSPMLKCIYYTDHSLKLLFNKLKMTPWFNNTLFVITSDHSANTNDHSPLYNTRLGAYRIPLLFYTPNMQLLGINTNIVQQIDIVPSVIDYLNVNYRFRCFGKSVFDKTTERYTYQLFNNSYQIADSSYLITFDGKNILSLFNHQTDPLLRNNLIAGEMKPQEMKKQKKLLANLQAVIQTYNYSMNNDVLVNSKVN